MEIKDDKLVEIYNKSVMLTAPKSADLGLIFIGVSILEVGEKIGQILEKGFIGICHELDVISDKIIEIKE